MILKVRVRSLRGIVVAVAGGCLVAAGLTTAAATRSGDAAASPTGGPYGVYVTTGGGESEVPMSSLGTGGSAFISPTSTAVGATAINASATMGVATIAPLATAVYIPPFADIFTVPGDSVVGQATGFSDAPVGYAMDPQDPNVSFAVTGSGNLYSFTLASGSHPASSLGPVVAGAKPTCSSIAITPDASTVVVACYGFLKAISLASDNGPTWSSALGGCAQSDVQIAPDGSAVFATAVCDGFSELVGLPLPFDSSTAPFWNGPLVLRGPLSKAGALAVSPNGSGLYVGGTGFSPNAASSVEEFSSSSGTAQGPATVPIDTDPNGGQGLTGLAFSPDGQTLLAYGQSAGTSDVIVPINPSNLQSGSQSASFGSGQTVGPQDIAITPDQAPVAGLSAASATAGLSLTLNASSTVSPSNVTYGSINRYVWTFGDGSPPATTSAPTVSHVYGSAGNYTASVVETDTAGTSLPPAPNAGGSAVNGPGTTPYLNASTSARASAPVAISRPGTPPPPIPTTTTVPSHGTTTTTKPPPGPANHPTLTLNPTVGSPGAVISVTGSGFTANTAVKVEWSTRTGSFDETTDGQGNLPAHDLPLITPDVLGPRFAVASVSGSPVAFAGFLAVPDTAKPGGSENGFLFRSEGP